MTVVPGPCDTPDMEVESSYDNDDNEDDPMASEDEIKKCEQNEQQKLLVMKVNQELDMKIAAATGRMYCVELICWCQKPVFNVG